MSKKRRSSTKRRGQRRSQARRAPVGASPKLQASAVKRKEVPATARASARSRLIVTGSLLGFAALVIVGMIVRPSESSLDGGTNLLLVILTGITAGGLSCLAVQGGLLATAVAQREELQIRDRLQREAALRHNARPILWFLGAKLVTYTALGALLGGLGSLLQPTATAQGAIQLAVALFMVATALHLLNVHPIFRFVVIQPPRFVTRRIRSRAKSADAFAPAILGAATVFLPCGVTQAMELLAIQSGSPALGAAIMFAFVLGTSPIFFLLGYFATTLGETLRARFFKLAAIPILILGLTSLNAAMTLLGTRFTLDAAREALAAGGGPATPAVVAPDGIQEVRIKAGGGGYSPGKVSIRAGEPARVIFVTDGSAGCT
ncbi:MAG: sulfite exporter TauE/SafE family protein, partial [Gaiellaceae bacterium]